MATVAEQIKTRAETAELLLEDVQSKIAEIKRNYAETAGKEFTAKLSRENESLRAEITLMKQKLSFVEVQNGVPQIAIPIAHATVKAENGSTASVITEKKNSTEVATASKDQLSSSKKENKAPKKKDEANKAKPAADADKPIDVSRLDLRIGLIESVEFHPDADSLYVEKVNIGTSSQRTILSGLVKHVPIEEMRSKKAIFICNMKPAKMRGITSEGMILCASTPEKVEILSVPDDAVIGSRITFNEYPGEPDTLLAPKKKIWEQVAPDLKVDSNGIATYKGAPFRLDGNISCKAPTLTNVQIK